MCEAATVWIRSSGRGNGSNKHPNSLLEGCQLENNIKVDRREMGV